LFIADVWTREDDLEWNRAYMNHTKLPLEVEMKYVKAKLACQQHFSKLPKVPVRNSKPKE
jgi:hypothetical protein